MNIVTKTKEDTDWKHVYELSNLICAVASFTWWDTTEHLVLQFIPASKVQMTLGQEVAVRKPIKKKLVIGRENSDFLIRGLVHLNLCQQMFTWLKENIGLEFAIWI